MNKTKHDKCRAAYTRASRALRKRFIKGVVIEMTTTTLFGHDGAYEVRNIYGRIWTGKACCKWRARAMATKVLIARVSC